jgi:hypothetical protein
VGKLQWPEDRQMIAEHIVARTRDLNDRGLSLIVPKQGGDGHCVTDQLGLQQTMEPIGAMRCVRDMIGTSLIASEPPWVRAFPADSPTESAVLYCRVAD